MLRGWRWRWQPFEETHIYFSHRMQIRAWAQEMLWLTSAATIFSALMEEHREIVPDSLKLEIFQEENGPLSGTLKYSWKEYLQRH